MVFAALISVMLAFFLLPVIGLLSRALWGSAWEQLRSGPVLEALRISLSASILAAFSGLLFGFPLAWEEARFERLFRSREVHDRIARAAEARRKE